MSYNIVITADNSGARSAINDTEKALNNMAATAKEGAVKSMRCSAALRRQPRRFRWFHRDLIH